MNGEGEDVFSGEVGTQPQMVNVQTPGTMMMVERSPAAQVIGILVILWSLLGVGMNILGLATLSFLSTVEEAGIEELPIMLFAVAALLQLIPAVIGIIGGYQMFQFQKKGLWLVLASLVLGWVIGIVNSALTSDYGGSGDAGIDAAFSGVCGLGCVAVCGLIVCIPLLFAHNGLE
jgi:hypothetical protein